MTYDRVWSLRARVAALALATLATLALARPAAAECNLTETRCTYTCIEYYPNGIHCRKTRKDCEEVCVEYEVKKSHQEHVPGSEHPGQGDDD